MSGHINARSSPCMSAVTCRCLIIFFLKQFIKVGDGVFLKKPRPQLKIIGSGAGSWPGFLHIFPGIIYKNILYYDTQFHSQSLQYSYL